MDVLLSELIFFVLFWCTLQHIVFYSPLASEQNSTTPIAVQVKVQRLLNPTQFSRKITANRIF